MEKANWRVFFPLCPSYYTLSTSQLRCRCQRERRVWNSLFTMYKFMTTSVYFTWLYVNVRVRLMIVMCVCLVCALGVCSPPLSTATQRKKKLQYITNTLPHTLAHPSKVLLAGQRSRFVIFLLSYVPFSISHSPRRLCSSHFLFTEHMGIMAMCMFHVSDVCYKWICYTQTRQAHAKGL